MAALVFTLSAFTDALDGYLARRLNKVTPEGQFLDPIADKVLVSSTLILLVHLQRIDVSVVLILINRDIFVSGIRSMAALKGWVLSARPLGQWKTALQMGGIPLILLNEEVLGLRTSSVGLWLVVLSLPLSLISAWDYWRAYRAYS